MRNQIGLRWLCACGLIGMALSRAVADDTKPAVPIDCWDFETTVNALKAHPEADCNDNGVIDSCDTFGARFADHTATPAAPGSRGSPSPISTAMAGPTLSRPGEAPTSRRFTHSPTVLAR